MDFFIAGLNTENCGVLAIHGGERLGVKRDSHAKNDSHARNDSQERKVVAMQEAIAKLEKR